MTGITILGEDWSNVAIENQRLIRPSRDELLNAAKQQEKDHTFDERAPQLLEKEVKATDKHG